MDNPHDISLLEQREFLLGQPVVILTGNEFARKEGATLTQQVSEYYNSIGNKAISPVYGDIILDKKGVDDDFAHGVGRIKAIAFAAIPQVIERGIVILPFGKYKSGENVVSAMIAAPVRIAEKEYVCVVVLRKRQEITKLYVHEVTLKEKLLADSSNPTQRLAARQGVISNALTSSSNPTQRLAAHQGDIAKILSKIISAKSD
ncbi:MAG: hypothetical protein LBQ78_02860 [Tannerellaceae bacterium]|jgi:hypothetical protein|nr:hypothetical protein [Tannerellaceae bacterium]